jgi:hypothetical protein
MVGTPTPVTGLPADLTGVGPSLTMGAQSILWRNDGVLIVGEVAQGGQVLEIHEITLGPFNPLGTPMAADVRRCITTVPAGWTGSIDQMDFLPNGDVLFSVRTLPATTCSGTVNAFSTTVLGILSTANAVVPVPVGPLPPGIVNALAFDAATSTLWVGMFVYLPATNLYTSTIYSIPFPPPAGTSLTPVATFPNQGALLNLAVDDTGRVLASFLGTTAISIINPATATVTQVPLLPAPTNINGIAVERVTGDVAFVTDDPFNSRAVFRAPSNGGSWSAANMLTPTLLPAIGNPSGIAIHPDPKTYGTATPGANTYAWALAPNPGGLPVIGNSGFSLTLVSTPAGAPGIWGAGLAALVPPSTGILPPIALNIDPANLVLWGPLAGQPVETISLPIPQAPILSGQTFYFQSAHFDPAGLAGSAGLQVTIL